MSMIIIIDPCCLTFWHIVYNEIMKFVASTWRWEYVEDDNNNNKVVFMALIPGMKMDDVHINLDVQGKFVSLTKHLHIFEWWFNKKRFEIRRFCNISKTFDLPDGVKLLHDFQTSIKDDDGVLNVTVTFNRDTLLETLLNRSIGFLCARMYWEEGEKHVFKAHLPHGMNKDDVNIEIGDGDKLRIIKQLDIEEGLTIPDWLLREFSDSKICRSFNLPKGLSFTTPTNNQEFKIDDETEDGVVTVTVTFVDEPKKKKKKKKMKNPNKKLIISTLLRLLAKAAAPKPKLFSKLQRVLAKTTAPVRAFSTCHPTLR